MNVEGSANVERALEMLARWKYCRAQGVRLYKCAAASNVGSVSDGVLSNACAEPLPAFRTCARSQTQNILRDLVKIADAKCPHQVAAYQACCTQRGESRCEAEDRAALKCAALEVLKSASANASAPGV